MAMGKASVTTQHIQVEQQGAVAWVRLNRPDLHNAFNDEMIQELQAAFTSLGAASEVRVVILAANGKSFCAGADLNWMKRMVDYTREENERDAMALATMLKTIHDCPKPVIARVHGAAFGGGVGLISACDFAVATANASFALTEVKLGLLPAVISPFVLKKLPTAQAQRYFLTAERFDAPSAKAMGLVADVVADEAELDAWLEARVAALLANGPEALAKAKLLIDAVLNINWPAAMQKTSELIAERRASHEGQEGMRAFLEKRSPYWNP